MPPPNKKKAATACKKQKDLEDKNKLLEAKIALPEGAKTGEKRGTSPTEQALVAAYVKRAHQERPERPQIH